MGTALGGPYLGVHLRRRDFIWGHREDVPSLQGAVKKIHSLLKMLKLEKVFVATDAVEEGRQISHFRIGKFWQCAAITAGSPPCLQCCEF